MTGKRNKLRSLFLVMLMVTSVFAGTIAMSGAAAAEFERSSVSGNAPVIVFAGEELDVTQVTQTGGSLIGSGDVTFTGLAGDADGTVESDNAASVDFGGFETGTYDTDGDERADFAVRQASISNADIETAAGTDVTDRSVTRGQSATLTLTDLAFNFDGVDDVEVTVEDEDGLDITNEVVTGNTILENEDDETTLDLSGQPAGTYTVTLEDETGDLGAELSVNVTLRETEFTLDLSDSEVTQGEFVTATAEGPAGETVHLRVRNSELRNGQDAADLFRNTGDVESIVDQGDFAVVVLDLGADGRAQASMRTEALKADRTVAIDLASGTSVTNPIEDSMDLEVLEKQINIAYNPSSVVINEEFTVNGTAPEIDRVWLYVKVDNEWEPLFENPGSPANSFVNSNDEWEIDADSGLGELAIAGNYRVAVVTGFDQLDGTGEVPAADGGDVISRDQFGELTSSSFSLRSTDGNLTAEIDRTNIATDDEIELTGTAQGQGSNVRVYVVGPRGDIVTFEEPSIRDNEYELTLDDFTRRGKYNVFVAGQGRDGDYGGAPSAIFRAGLNQQQTSEAIRDLHSGATVDDQLIQRNLTATVATLTVDPIGTRNMVAQGDDNVTVTGATNREAGTLVFLEVENSTTDDVVASAEAETGSQGEWSTTIDLSDLSNGTYELRADDGETTDNLTFQIVDQVPQTGVTFEDQTTEGRTVVVANGYLVDGGFITIHDASLQDGDALGSVRGTSTYLSPGAVSDLPIRLDEAPTSASTYIAMPHRDTNNNQQYDFVSSDGSADGPYTRNGTAVTDAAEISPPSTPTPTPTEEPTDTPTETPSEPTETMEPTDEPTDEPTTTSTGQPGFTVIVALMAFLAAALLAIRRD